MVLTPDTLFGASFKILWTHSGCVAEVFASEPHLITHTQPPPLCGLRLRVLVSCAQLLEMPARAAASVTGDASSARDTCELILRHYLASPSATTSQGTGAGAGAGAGTTSGDAGGGGGPSWQLGTTRVFLRAGLLELLQAAAVQLQDAAATALQAVVRGKTARQLFQQRKSGVSLMQAFLRGRLCRQRFHYERGEVVRLQSWWRKRRARCVGDGVARVHHMPVAHPTMHGPCSGVTTSRSVQPSSASRLCTEDTLAG